MGNILATLEASDDNLTTSIWQHLFTNVKIPYDQAALATGIDQGTSSTKSGSLVPDSGGLGILTEIDFDDLFKRVPVLAFNLDAAGMNHSPKTIGAGDGANWEWRSVLIRCAPAITYSMQQNFSSPDARSLNLLRTYAWKAIGRRSFMPIVDSTAARINGLYPAIGYAEIHNQRLPRPPASKDQLLIDRRDFDIEFDIRFAVLTDDGL